ncbi:MAG: DUF4249 domain-containing protein [Bacteroidales bacterium]
MKMKGVIRYLPALMILAIAAGSCESVIEFKGDGADPKPVIYSILHPDSLIQVSVAMSHAVFDERYEPKQITNAVVRVFRDGTLIDNLTYKTPGPNPDWAPADPYSRYVSGTNRPFYGSIYRIEVEIPGTGTASGEAMLPENVPIIRIDTGSVTAEWGERLLEVKVKFRDPAGEDNHYRVTARGIGGSYYGNKGEPYLPFNPVVVTEADLSYGVFNEPLITPRQDDDIFGMYLQNTYSLFSDELIAGKEYDLTLRYNYKRPDPEYYEFVHSYFSLHSISRDLYLYLQSLSAHIQTRENFLAEPVMVYTNVSDGLGVVGAMSTYTGSLKIGEYPVEGVFYEYYQYNR